MAIQGINYTASDAAEFVRKEKAWNELYNQYPTGQAFEDLALASRQDIQTDLMSQLLEIENSKRSGITLSKDLFAQSLGNLSKSTQQGVLDDFVNTNAQKNMVIRSNLGQGYKESIAGNLDESLNRAYESWFSNHRNQMLENKTNLDSTISGYESAAAQAKAQAEANAAMLQGDITAIEEQNQQIIAKLDEARLTEGQNYVDFNKAILDYADWLFDNEELIDTNAFNNEDWKKYFMGTNGYIGSTRLTERMYDKVIGEDGREEYILNKDGRMILNMLMSDPLALQTDSEGNSLVNYGFDKYLEEENPELMQWLMSPSAYYTEDTPYLNNMDYALKMFGLDAVDYVYKGNMINPETKLPETFDATPEGYRDIQVAYNDNNPDKANVNITDNGTTNYYRGKDAGTVATYVADNGTPIVAFEELEVKGFNLFSNWDNGKIDNKDGETFKIGFTDDSGTKRTYNLELVDEDAGGENIVINSNNAIYKDIQSHVGNLVPNRLYGYGDDIYAAVDTGSGIVLRKVQGTGSNKDGEKLTQMMRNNSWGKQYSAKDIYDGNVLNTMTDEDKHIAARNEKYKEWKNNYDINTILVAKGGEAKYVPEHWIERFRNPNYRWDNEYGAWRYRGKLLDD